MQLSTQLSHYSQMTTPFTHQVSYVTFLLIDAG